MDAFAEVSHRLIPNPGCSLVKVHVAVVVAVYFALILVLLVESISLCVLHMHMLDAITIIKGDFTTENLSGLTSEAKCQALLTSPLLCFDSLFERKQYSLYYFDVVRESLDLLTVLIKAVI